MPALLDSRFWKKVKDEHYAASGEDVWLLKGSGGGRTGAVLIMKPKPEVVAKLLVDMETCNSCIPGNPVSHATTTVRSNGAMYTYQCRSGSRAIDPTTGELVGHAHCTCDGCF